MNYQEARQLSDKTGWHMTIQNDDKIWTHTCCRQQVPATEKDVKDTDWIYHGRLKVGDLIAGPPHDPHPSRKDAEDCYHEWRLRQIRDSLEFGDQWSGSWQGCEAVVGPGGDEGEPVLCDEPTKGGARYRDDHSPEHMALCPKHRDAEVVLANVRRVTASAYS